MDGRLRKPRTWSASQPEQLSAAVLAGVLLAHAAAIYMMARLPQSVTQANETPLYVSFILPEALPMRAQSEVKATPVKPLIRKIVDRPAPVLKPPVEKGAPEPSLIANAAIPPSDTKSSTPALAPTTPEVTASDAPATKQAVAQPAAVEEAVEQPRFNADYLDNPAPVYPPLSRKLREQGTVLLRVRVSIEGRPVQITLHQSSGYSRLDTRALDTVERWKFIPARRAEQPVEAWVIVPIQFSLKG